MNKIVKTKKYNEKTFEDIKHTEIGYEYWLARELYPLLEYGTWDKFLNVV